VSRKKFLIVFIQVSVLLLVLKSDLCVYLTLRNEFEFSKSKLCFALLLQVLVFFGSICLTEMQIKKEYSSEAVRFGEIAAGIFLSAVIYFFFLLLFGASAQQNGSVLPNAIIRTSINPVVCECAFGKFGKIFGFGLCNSKSNSNSKLQTGCKTESKPRHLF